MDDLHHFALGVTIQNIVVFQLHLQLFPVSKSHGLVFLAGALDSRSRGFNIPPKFRSNLRVFDKSVKLVGAVFAVSHRNFDLMLAGSSRPRDAELREPSNTPAPVHFILEESYPDAVAHKVVTEPLVVKLKLLPLP